MLPHVICAVFSYLLHYLFFFFFSSRRRHTRYWRDWSSDVCSSDLPACGVAALKGCATSDVRGSSPEGLRYEPRAPWQPARSEERRVGKECRSRWSPYH